MLHGLIWSNILFISWSNDSSKAACGEAGKLNSDESTEQQKQAKETYGSQLSQVREHSLGLSSQLISN